MYLKAGTAPFSSFSANFYTPVIAPTDFSNGNATKLNLTVQQFLQKTRVARFFSVHDTKNGKNVPREQKIYLMVIKYP
jgi:hypothetical protein